MKILRKIKTLMSNYFYELFHFGFKVAHYSFWGELSDFNIIKGNMAIRIKDKRRETIYNYLMKKYARFIEDYKNKEVLVGENTKKIWCLWWQGIDNAPLIVKKCIESIKKNKGDYEFVLITKDNYMDYVDIDKDIIDKLNNKIISITHFSDILRGRLLSIHGGIWVDATMYFSENVFKEFDNKIFNSCSNNIDDSKPDYTGFFMGGKPNKLFSFLYDFLILYNKEYNRLINYFLIDYIILIAYRNFDECHDYIESVTIKNKDIFKLPKMFNQVYNEKEYNKLCKDAKFFKLTYKKKYQNYIDGQLTNYGYFIGKS